MFVRRYEATHAIPDVDRAFVHAVAAGGAGLRAPIGQGLWQLAEATQQGRLSLSEAADLVQRRTGGRILAAQALREQGRDVYRIKVLTRQGEVRVVLVDAVT